MPHTQRGRVLQNTYEKLRGHNRVKEFLEMNDFPPILICSICLLLKTKMAKLPLLKISEN